MKPSVTMKSRAAVWVIAALLTHAGLAHAQTSPVDEHLRRGVDLRRAGRDDESVREFEAAYALSREARTAAQLGLVRQALGRWLDADRLLREALATPDDPWVTRNRASLDAAFEVVNRHVGRLLVRGNVEGAEVRVDDALVATLPMTDPARVLAGTVSLEVRASGYETVSRRFVVDPSLLVQEFVELRPAVIAPPPPVIAAPSPVLIAPSPVIVAPPLDAPSRWPARRVWATASLATGGAALVLAGVAAALREDAAVRYNSGGCPPLLTRSVGACADLASQATAWETTAWIALPVGTALAATGVVLWLLPTRATPSATRCAPSFTEPGLSCATTF
jgi:hypothetical protein